MKFATRVIHAGMEPDPSTGAIIPPIYQTSTYVQAAPGQHKGYEYARSQNPTRTALETALASIENARYALSFSSGVAASDAVIRLLVPGDEVIAASDMYGGTFRLFSKIFEKAGIHFHYVNMQDVNNIRPLINAKTKLVWTETPTNPLMNVVDLDAVASVCKEKKLLFCVDNTFASPSLQNPLDFGADIVIHSATKYLGGHSDVIHGCLMLNDLSLRDQLYFIQKSCGAVPGPQDCFLVLRGIKTLQIRMQRHCENGEKVAHWLRGNKKLSAVYWCGFEDQRARRLYMTHAPVSVGIRIIRNHKQIPFRPAYPLLTDQNTLLNVHAIVIVSVYSNRQHCIRFSRGGRCLDQLNGDISTPKIVSVS